MPDQTKRVLIAAEAIALIYGDKWNVLDVAAKAHYRKEALAVVNALARYDKEVRAAAIRAGWARSTKAGLRGSPGTRSTVPVETAEKARQMIRDHRTSREIRQATGLGNSTITRLKSELVKEAANVHPSDPNLGRPATGAAPV
jgi:DNA invertase Pin-like site-specific DNA recombinase